MSSQDYILAKALTYGSLKIKRLEIDPNLYNTTKFAKKDWPKPGGRDQRASDPEKISEDTYLYLSRYLQTLQDCSAWNQFREGNGVEKILIDWIKLSVTLEKEKKDEAGIDWILPWSL